MLHKQDDHCDKKSFAALKSKYFLNIQIVQTVEQLIRSNTKKRNRFTTLAFLTVKAEFIKNAKARYPATTAENGKYRRVVLSQSHERDTRECNERNKKIMLTRTLDTKTVEKEVPRHAADVLSLSYERDEKVHSERSRKSHAFWCT